MKKITFTLLLPILILSACKQQESELASSATANQETATQDTLPDITAAAAAAGIANCQVQAETLLPPDNPPSDTSLVAYLQEMEQVVQAQNPEGLRKLVSPDISTGFDGSGGWSDFARQWHPENEGAEVWLLLEHLLRLGGGYPVEGRKDIFALPYVYSNWPDSIDAFMHVAVVKTGAILREEPAANASAVCSLNQVILKVDYGKSYPEDAPQKEWWHVESADGELQGYLHHPDVHSPVGYRAIFNKNKRGKWQMTALVAGD
ncbi:hypothetical protein [Pontibacter anaerobius]|uniref:SH3 domain-containing protein n=1 Tax=Pontibacter anaerobius TaxID=2993940 RepID=A0ABT3RDN6_9BACT|nr:hypothetical protein [Pontibacter anaerobius]MCX2739647.1 hypothetical protein [Pontibacter anaerobius]